MAKTSAKDRGDAGQSSRRKSRPPPTAAAAAAPATTRSGVSDVSSSLSVNNPSSVGLAGMRRASGILRVAAEKKAKKVLSVG